MKNPELSTAEKITLMKPIMGSAKVAERAVAYLATKSRVPDVETIVSEMNVPKSTAAKIRSAALLAACYLIGTTTVKVSSPKSAVDMVPELKYMENEHLVVLTMTGNYEVLGRHFLTVGSYNRTIVDPKDVYTAALKDGASRVIVFHNHPASSLEPSPDDLDFTGRLSRAGRALGITLSDSIIVTKTGFTSIYTEYPETF